MQIKSYILFILLHLFLFNPSFLQAQDLPVDLTALDAYVRLGFNKSWIQTLPAPGDSHWKIIKANKGNRPLRVQELGFEGLPRWIAFQRNTDIITLTYLFEFSLQERTIKGGHMSLYLAQVGQNWEVHLNGNLLRSEYFPDSNQGLLKIRSLRKQLIEVPQHTLRSGKNILAFRIVGDPSINRHGFYMKRNYLIDRQKNLVPLQDERIELMFVAIYFFAGFYHLILYLRRPKEKYNLPLALAIMTPGLLFLVRSNFMISFVEDTSYIRPLEPLSSILGIALFQVFLDLIIRKKPSLYTKISFPLAVFAALLTIPFEREVLPPLQKSMPVYFLYMLIYNLVIPFAEQFKVRLRLYPRNTRIVRILKSISSVLFLTVPGNLFIGMNILAVTLILDVNNSVTGNPQLYTRYAFFAFILGLVLLVANRFMRIHKNIEKLNLRLEEKVRDRTRKLNRVMNKMKKSFQEVRYLKTRQDADYFLTSLLLKPLGGNQTSSGGVNIEILEKQFKQFKYQKWNSEIGGDYSYAGNLKLRGNNYKVVLSSDAMGKSMQGAGGALVMGSVFRSLITTTQIDPGSQDKAPETWLADCHNQLQNVFVSFDGSMMISMVLGLLAEEEGIFYFINAEHPRVVLYRDKSSRFIAEEGRLRKVGISFLDSELKVNAFQMLPGDVLILGSDGRDDIVLNVDQQGERQISDDENEFLIRVNEGQGKLSGIQDSILRIGDLMDDFSLLRIGFKEDQVQAKVVPSAPE